MQIKTNELINFSHYCAENSLKFPSERISNLIEFNKKLFLDFNKKFPKITFSKPEMCTFENMLEFKSVNPSSL